jgi:predicted nucleic acid-binding protein
VSGFLLDTNIPSELTRSRPDSRVADWLEATDDNSLYVSVITLGEIQKGLTVMPDRRRRLHLQRWLEEELHPWFFGRILPVDEAVAERWGALDGERQLQGLPLNTADGLIVATALEHGLTLVTRNIKDFVGLSVPIFNPWGPL